MMVPTDVTTKMTQPVLQVIKLARLAPSAHNTQPWRLSVGPSVIHIHIDWSRHLAISDPTQRQLYVGLGCLVTYICIAAQWEGFIVTIERLPEGDVSEGDSKPVVSIHLDAALGKPTMKNSLYESLAKRRTHRELYDGLPLTEREKSQLMSDGDDLIKVIEERERITAIGDLTEAATRRTLARPDFKKELSKWVRNNWTKRGDGMPGYAMGVPAPLSLVASAMVKRAPIHKQEAPKANQQLRSASAIVVFVTDNDEPKQWLQAGESLCRVWLHATSIGLVAAPIVTAIEAGNDTRESLRKVLRTQQLPQSLLRVGHSDQIRNKPTPRRELSDLLS